MRLLYAFALVGGTSPALPALAALECNFQQECFEAEGCQSSTFALEAALDGEVLDLSTEFGALEVMHHLSEPGLLSVFARDSGAAYLLSSGEDGARLSVHVEGPLAVTYIGSCEGVL